MMKILKKWHLEVNNDKSPGNICSWIRQDQMGSDKIRQDQIGSDRIRQDQIGSDRTAPEAISSCQFEKDSNLTVYF